MDRSDKAMRSARRAVASRLTLAAGATLLMGVAGLLASAPAGQHATQPDTRPAVDPAQHANLALQQAANEAFDLAASTLQPLEFRWQGKGDTLVTEVALGDRALTLELFPKSLRAAGYQVLAQVADGSLVPVEPEPDRTYRGHVLEEPGSVVAGSLLDDGLHAVVYLPDGQRYWIEPVAGRIAGAPAELHVVYRGEDVQGMPGVCGNQITSAGNVIDEGLALDGVNNSGGTAGLAVCETQLACDADVEYFLDYGSSIANVQNRIHLVINTMNPQYETQVGITHTITTIIVRTAEPDPYSSNDSDTLLCQFLTHWTNNHGDIVRDVAKLFTGRNINGATIGQATNFGEICDLNGFCQNPPALDDGGYCYSESDCCGSLACATDLAAHELGHLWSATHCSCPNSTMNPSITCANSFNAGSINQIVSFRNSVNCLNCAAPANNACANAITVSNGTTNFSTFQATTDGPDESANCNQFGYSQVGSDIWFRYIASCTGNVTVSLCNSNYDTKLAIYSGGCPTGANQSIACNDDSCGAAGTRSSVTFPAVAGNEYRIRVGGYQGATGSGEMTITCTLANDNCTFATVVGNGATPFSTVGATTDGPLEGTVCNFFGYADVGNDVWFRYTATCIGPVTVDLCNSNYDTKVAVYAGPKCPGGAGTAIACNDDACGSGGTRSRVTFDAIADNQYRIRVGGYQGATGSGIMVITCGSTCVGDIAPSGGNGTVGVEDLLAVINAWGPCSPGNCPADIVPPGGNGTVGVDDLLYIINHWGPCP